MNSLSLRLQHHLDALVLVIAEQAIGSGRVLERQAMRDDERRIDFTALNPFEQRLHVSHHVRLTHSECQALLKRRTERNLVEEPAVHAGD